MTSIEVHVVAHPIRQEQAEKLAKEVEATETWVDTSGLGEWDNHLRAWTQLSYSGATHAVVLQDDAIPVEGFREHAQRAATDRPNSMISLYIGTHRPRASEVVTAIVEADRQGASWLSADTLMWGVGVIVPVTRIPEMLEAVEGCTYPYDQRLGTWPKDLGEEVYYTWPSLVDHMDQKSTVWRSNRLQQGTRVAHRTGIPNWSDIVVEIKKETLIPMVESTRDRRK